MSPRHELDTISQSIPYIDASFNKRALALPSEVTEARPPSRPGQSQEPNAQTVVSELHIHSHARKSGRSAPC